MKTQHNKKGMEKSRGFRDDFFLLMKKIKSLIKAIIRSNHAYSHSIYLNTKETVDTEIIKKRIPKNDFIDVAFDNHMPYIGKPNSIILILSTPRCGSTFLCDLFYRNHICLPHEYFQPYQYLPISADRWGCLHDRSVSAGKYIRGLIRNRTSNEGILGINLHGIHLQYFVPVMRFLKGVRIECLVLDRKSIISQAVSYSIALQTGKWTSFYEGTVSPEYDKAFIDERYRDLVKQKEYIDAFLEKYSLRSKRFYYEELFDDRTKDYLKRKFEILDFHSPVTKQRSRIKEEWSKRYFEERGFPS